MSDQETIINKDSSQDKDKPVNSQEYIPDNYGICYDCREPCNPSSQLCGRCARKLTARVISGQH